MQLLDQVPSCCTRSKQQISFGSDMIEGNNAVENSILATLGQYWTASLALDSQLPTLGGSFSQDSKKLTNSACINIGSISATHVSTDSQRSSSSSESSTLLSQQSYDHAENIINLPLGCKISSLVLGCIVMLSCLPLYPASPSCILWWEKLPESKTEAHMPRRPVAWPPLFTFPFHPPTSLPWAPSSPSPSSFLSSTISLPRLLLSCSLSFNLPSGQFLALPVTPWAQFEPNELCCSNVSNSYFAGSVPEASLERWLEMLCLIRFPSIVYLFVLFFSLCLPTLAEIVHCCGTSSPDFLHVAHARLQTAKPQVRSVVHLVHSKCTVGPDQIATDPRNPHCSGAWSHGVPSTILTIAADLGSVCQTTNLPSKLCIDATSSATAWAKTRHRVFHKWKSGMGEANQADSRISLARLTGRECCKIN